MESPLNVGDITTNSIQNRLSETHLGSTCSSLINSAIYSGQRVIQLTLNLQITKENSAGNTPGASSLVILRRVKDSYINVSQLFQILIRLGHFTSGQVENYFRNEILSNMQYAGSGAGNVQYNDYRNHDNVQLQGLWIPYDKAVSLALKFDIYDFVKKLFLIDVHDFDKLPPRSAKRLYEDEDDDDDQSPSLMGSPTKRQKVKDDAKRTPDPHDDGQAFASSRNKSIKLSSKNPNFPYTLPPITKYNEEVATDLKLKLGELFKLDEAKNSALTLKEVSAVFQPLLTSSSKLVLDIPLDQKGQTALHFASTLASSVLISSFIDLGITSPIRGNLNGESPLVSTIQVTNSLEKGNFNEILTNWLFPNIWLFDNKKWTIFHHLIFQATKKFDSSKFYFKKIIEYVVSNEKHLKDFIEKLINSKDEENGNTCLHLAAEYELKWFTKVLVLLKADVNIANNGGIKPIDFDAVKDIVGPEETVSGKKTTDEDEDDVHFFELITTSTEFLDQRLAINGNIDDIEDPKDLDEFKPSEEHVASPTEPEDSKSSNKIFQSIQNLLKNTNLEYESILNSKRLQIKNLNQAVNDAVIVTANNRFTTKKISEKLVLLDNLKLQISNINDKLNSESAEEASDSGLQEQQYIIQPLFQRMVADEPIDDLKNDPQLHNQLQPVPILNARINAYKQVNQKLEAELTSLLDYSELTSKFKKVVSICTGVDINEVDELLDGLLEAVEGQQ
ncbi:uncharacterized protein CANTADRAFT_7418 [Suhomyces tanzawaensis NRRL Y-17324]|uniref:HTH APSES-type domain-containing protein n=1 Tax=Suhomyces tanzawaensis NRRL Y-17324 TaxID=984487 RepID=A0A1E4SEJ5_9ASCO|nr:uncharacterized protein CANTADRAFT_7418 [Suhomyces tanzawaensis NRRL Y-17324]ODV77944.1 hypothetical protein CANTADRAFT_7418 [Suhomyces tanzawaensis NRRL Y-17324]